MCKRQPVLPLPSCRRGITLVEFTIVLLIFGMIVGAIMTAFPHVRAGERRNRAIDELNLVLHNVRSLYAGRQLTASGACPTGGTALASTSGVFPESMIRGTRVHNPWNNSASSSSAFAYVCGTNPFKIVLRYSAVPSQDCIDLVTRTSSQQSGLGLVQISVGGTTTISTGGVVSVAAAEVACEASGGIIDWYYTLSGQETP
jgi:type II secretory pathway pseudopilin PulG